MGIEPTISGLDLPSLCRLRYKVAQRKSGTISGLDLPSLCRLRYKVAQRKSGTILDSHRGQKIFSLPRVVPCFPLLGLTPSGLFMGLSSTLIYTSELILCSTMNVVSTYLDIIFILFLSPQAKRQIHEQCLRSMYCSYQTSIKILIGAPFKKTNSS